MVYGGQHIQAREYVLGIFRTLHKRHKTELQQMRNEEPPLWQTAPREWKPIKVLPHASSTVVRGKEARKEKTTTVVQGEYHLQPDREYVDNWKDPPAFVPLCHAGARGP